MSDIERDGQASRVDAEDVTVDLPELSPRNTRQQWTRSALASVEDEVVWPVEDETMTSADGVPEFVLGTAHGVVRSFNPDGTESWAVDLGGMAVALEPTLVDDEPVVFVGTRGETAVLALLDAVEGTVRWRRDLESDLGAATKETLFYYPMTVALASDDGHLYAAARRYERAGDDRRFESRVYAVEPDGSIAWTYDADASPIALDRRDDRLAVAYNRCHGDHQCGLVVLDADTGDPDLTWDPGSDGDRRVGDVVLDDDGAVVASHGDYRGYALDRDGAERWRVDLGRPVGPETEVDDDHEDGPKPDVDDDREDGPNDEVVYTYPNHVALEGDHVLFVTGNSFPETGRETDARHPREHTLIAVSRDDGRRAWTTPIGGWLGGTDDTADAPGDGGGQCLFAVGQHFRDRDPETHGVRVVDPTSGGVEHRPTDGVAADVAVTADRVATLEEPIAYHDEEGHRGAYRLHLRSG